MIQTDASISCEIVAKDEVQLYDLERITQRCAIDIKLSLPINILKSQADKTNTETRIDIFVPVELAVAYDAVWSLACRVACFCPQARITAQIQSEKDSA
ncbi:hypothetical protein MLD52_07140 [Puniceicoccaceae bacterium K14]|nr:hypothetical protein [Puniceicoccaceae bacterium K14]